MSTCWTAHMCCPVFFKGVCVCLPGSWCVLIGSSSRSMSLTGWITVISHYWLSISELHTPLYSTLQSLQRSLSSALLLSLFLSLLFPSGSVSDRLVSLCGVFHIALALSSLSFSPILSLFRLFNSPILISGPLCFSLFIWFLVYVFSDNFTLFSFIFCFRCLHSCLFAKRHGSILYISSDEHMMDFFLYMILDFRCCWAKRKVKFLFKSYILDFVLELKVMCPELRLWNCLEKHHDCMHCWSDTEACGGIGWQA